MKYIAAVMLLLMTVTSVSGCSWVGRTAGKAQAKIERKTNDLEEGYHQGYEREKAKEDSEGKKASDDQAR